MATTLDEIGYNPPGVAIGQLIVPQVGAVNVEARIPVVIGRGSRLATVRNRQIQRSAIRGEALTFTSAPPFTANLAYAANGNPQQVRVFSGSYEVPRSQWTLVKVNGAFTRVLLNTEAYDSSVTYQIDYVSTSRDPKDRIPVDGVRSVVAIGSVRDKPEFIEYRHFFLDSTFTNPLIAQQDGSPMAAHPTATVEAPVAASGNAGPGVAAQHSTSAFDHDYTRYYSAVCQAGPTAGVQQSFTLTVPVVGDLDNTATLTLNDGINAATVFRFDTDGNGSPGAGQIEIDVSGAANAAAVADLIRTAILARGPDLLLAPDAAGSATLVLTHRLPGAFGATVVSSDAQLTVAAGVGDAATGINRAATFHWTATPMSGGNAAEPPAPLHSSDAASCAFTLSQADAASLTPSLELGVKLAFDFGARLTISNLPSNGQRLTVRVGSLTKCFEFQGAGVQSQVLANGCITVTGNSKPTFAASLATALATAVSGLAITAVADTVPGNPTVTIHLTTPGSVLHVGEDFANVTTANQFSAGDAWTFNGLGPALFEIDERHRNGNQWPKIETPVRSVTGAATITAIAQNQLVDGETFTINDGVNAATVFEFDTNGVVSTGNVAVNIAAAVSASSVATAMQTAINSVAGSLAVTASIASNATDVVRLSHDQNGTVLISDSVLNAGFVHASSTGLVSVSPTAGGTVNGVSVQYTGTYNGLFRLRCTATSGTVAGVNRTATFVWAEHGDRKGVNGTFTIQEATASTLTQTLVNGVKLVFAFGTGNATTESGFRVGDVFRVTARAPRELYQAKDDRNYTLTVTSSTVSSPFVGVTRGTVEGTFVTDTREGRFGTFTAADDSFPESNSLHQNGHFTLPGNIRLAARNLYKGPVSAITGSRHAQDDEHQFLVTIDDTINWSLTDRTTETLPVSKIWTDITGRTVGSPNTKYVTLAKTPTEIISVKKNGVDISYTWISGTPYVWFPTDPADTVEISYEWRTAEPDPGAVYYFSGNYVRPESLYNSAQLITSLEAGRQLLGPAEVDNHLYIANEIAWSNLSANAGRAVYYVQVADADDDGIFTPTDFSRAILASEPPSNIRDVVLLDGYASWGDLLASVDRMNDPFAARERLAWFGAPNGMPIGNEDTADTMIYTAQNTLQVFGQSPAHGTRIFVGTDEATVDIVLQDGRTVNVTVDGSFVALALACICAGFNDPATSILRRRPAGFRSISTFGPVNSPDNKRLGQNQIIYLTTISAGIYQIEEDVTVDNYAEDFREINQMCQKQFVTTYIRGECESKLPGVTVESPQDGATIVQSFVGEALSNLIGRGRVGSYLDDAGSPRKFSPASDVVATVDSSDGTKFHFAYLYFLKKTAKRFRGLYSVNSNDFGRLRGSYATQSA